MQEASAPRIPHFACHRVATSEAVTEAVRKEPPPNEELALPVLDEGW